MAPLSPSNRPLPPCSPPSHTALALRVGIPPSPGSRFSASPAAQPARGARNVRTLRRAGYPRHPLQALTPRPGTAQPADPGTSYPTGERRMTTERMETFSDGVIAIIITIMALELKMPEGEGIASLWGVLPTFLAYLLSFVYLGIYWVNHHHMLRVTRHVNGKILWANLHLLFWLSIVPAATSWLGDHPRATVPTAVYAATMLMPAIAYYILQNAIISLEGPRSTL